MSSHFSKVRSRILNKPLTRQEFMNTMNAFDRALDREMDRRIAIATEPTWRKLWRKYVQKPKAPAKAGRPPRRTDGNEADGADPRRRERKAPVGNGPIDPAA